MPFLYIAYIDPMMCWHCFTNICYCLLQGCHSAIVEWLQKYEYLSGLLCIAIVLQVTCLAYALASCLSELERAAIWCIIYNNDERYFVFIRSNVILVCYLLKILCNSSNVTILFKVIVRYVYRIEICRPTFFDIIIT